MIKLKDLLNEGPKEMVSKIDKIAKKNWEIKFSLVISEIISI
jgi:hypothetical protein